MLGSLINSVLRESVKGAAAIVKAPMTIADAIADEMEGDR